MRGDIKCVNTLIKGERRFLHPRRPLKPGYVEPFREIARAEGFVFARQGDDLPWVFESEEWESMPEQSPNGPLGGRGSSGGA